MSDRTDNWTDADYNAACNEAERARLQREKDRFYAPKGSPERVLRDGLDQLLAVDLPTKEPQLSECLEARRSVLEHLQAQEVKHG